MMSKTFVIACLAIVVLTSGAFAQATPSGPDPNQGAFDKLSPGNQKIAQALFNAQQNTSTTAKPLSMDDIAAMKQDGKGWGGVFKEMHQEGLVQEKNLGQVVSQANHAMRLRHNGTVITSGSGRNYVAGTKMNQEPANVGAVQNRNDQRPQFTGDHGSLASGTGAGNSNAGGHGGRSRN